jgi:hypothetical protein
MTHNELIKKNRRLINRASAAHWRMHHYSMAKMFDRLVSEFGRKKVLIIIKKILSVADLPHAQNYIRNS